MVSDKIFNQISFVLLFSMYDKQFTSPLTVWYQKAKCPITQIKWCQLYFDDEQQAGGSKSPERKSKSD